MNDEVLKWCQPKLDTAGRKLNTRFLSYISLILLEMILQNDKSKMKDYWRSKGTKNSIKIIIEQKLNMLANKHEKWSASKLPTDCKNFLIFMDDSVSHEQGLSAGNGIVLCKLYFFNGNILPTFSQRINLKSI